VPNPDSLRRIIGRRLCLSLGLALVVALGIPASAFACETYVVGALGHGWHAQALVRVRVVAVVPTDPDSLNQAPDGYRLAVVHVFGGADVPAYFNVGRAAGCDTINLKLGDQLVVAISSGANLHLPAGSDPGYGPDNYNSAWYELTAGSRLRLAPGSAWVAGLGRNTTIAELLKAMGLPPTDVALSPTSGDPQIPLDVLAGVLAGAAALFLWRRTSAAGATRAARSQKMRDLV
jgi:hypothetical protein